jgi:NADH-ubiquinone oxidoreductase chain 5
MAGDTFYSRFILIVLLFVTRIRLLILSPNLIRILLGWDGLGVTSYLLVVYYQSEKSFNAGIVTALTNRLGDAGLLVIIGITLRRGSWAFAFFNQRQDFFAAGVAVVLILVSMTKSAQVPFSAWLPAAMAAPTPVSALVHSSTLVTAGVYLLIRLNYIIQSEKILFFLVFIGTVTIRIAGISAIFENDIKKIIALSTLSQLGLMFFTLGLGLPLLTFFHLVAHAYFKAILFIGAGGVIHGIADYQDLRSIGGSGRAMPTSLAIFSVGSIRLCGLPFLTGFFSKDLILELMLIGRINLIILRLRMLATGLTLAYSLRLVRLVFSRFEESGPCTSHKEDISLLMAPLGLLLPSIAGGMFISWAVARHLNVVFLPAWLKQAILVVLTISAVLFWTGSLKPKSKIFTAFLEYIWFLPFLFSPGFSSTGLLLRKNFYTCVEKRWLERVAVSVFSRLSGRLGQYRLYSLQAQCLKRVFFIGGVLLFIWKGAWKRIILIE